MGLVRQASETRLDTSEFVAFQGIRGDGDDGNVRGARRRSQNRQGLESVDSGQVDIHQDQRGRRGACQFDADLGGVCVTQFQVLPGWAIFAA